MWRRWARGLLSFLICLALVLGGWMLVRGSALPVLPGAAAIISTLDDQLHPGIEPSGPALEPSRQLAGGGGRGPGTGPKDPLPLFLALAALLTLVLIPAPQRVRLAGRVGTLQTGVPRPRGAGRCPTGPPHLA